MPKKDNSTNNSEIGTNNSVDSRKSDALDDLPICTNDVFVIQAKAHASLHIYIWTTDFDL